MEIINKLEPKKGRLLLAEPFAHDPYFKRAVILLTEHTESGTVGFILNKPLSITLGETIKDFKESDMEIYSGGPVGTDTIYFAHTIGEALEGSIEIYKGLYWGGRFESLKKLYEAGRINENDIKFFIGYTGWGKGQLENEMKEKSWIVAEGEIKYIINYLPDNMWKDVLTSMGKNYALLSNFPEDPQLN